MEAGLSAQAVHEPRPSPSFPLPTREGCPRRSRGLGEGACRGSPCLRTSHPFSRRKPLNPGRDPAEPTGYPRQMAVVQYAGLGIQHPTGRQSRHRLEARAWRPKQTAWREYVSRSQRTVGQAGDDPLLPLEVPCPKLRGGCGRVFQRIVQPGGTGQG